MLCILKKDFEYLYEKHQPFDPEVRKLVFTFNLDDSKSLNPSLTAFRAKNNDDFISKSGTTLLRNAKTYKLTGSYHFGNLELSKKNYDDYVKKLPGYATANRLLFYPIYDGTTHSIRYQLMWATGNCSIIAPDNLQAAPPPPETVLNPCPPNQPGT